MKKYSKEELVDITTRINIIERFIYRFKKQNGREPTIDEISNILQEPIERINEINQILKELEEQDKILENKLKLESAKHSKNDIIIARKKRKENKTLQDIKNNKL